MKTTTNKETNDMTRDDLHSALIAAGWRRVDRSNGRVDFYLVNSMIATIPECDDALCQVREGYRAQMSFADALTWAAGGAVQE